MKTKLIFAQAFLFFLVIVVFGLILVNEKGNLLFRGIIENKINSYYDEHYSSLTHIKKKELLFHAKDKAYTIVYQDTKKKDLTFTLTYKKGKITSNYQKNYIEGKSLLEKRKKEIEKKIKTVFKESNFELNKIDFYKLTDYLKEEQEKIIEEKDLTDSGLYIIEVTVKTTKSENDIDVINLLTTALEKNKIIPEKIILNLKKREEMSTITLEKGADFKWTTVYSVK